MIRPGLLRRIVLVATAGEAALCLRDDDLCVRLAARKEARTLGGKSACGEAGRARVVRREERVW